MQRRITELLLGLAAIAAIGLVIYYLTQPPKVEEEVDLTAVAAMVDGVEVREADITYTIEAMRLGSDGEPLSDKDWAAQLKRGDYTPESLREYVINNQFAVPIMVLSDADALGISPDAALIDQEIEAQKEAAGSPEDWVSYLRGMGFADEAAYRRLIEAQDVVTPLLETMFPDPEPTEKEVADFLEENSSYVTGKRSSAVMVAVDDQTSYEQALAIAEEAYGQIMAGADFAEVSDSYSSPDLPLQAGGDMGWQALTQLPDEYYAVLAGLAVGDVSSVSESAGYFFIVKCTDEYEIGEEGFIAEAMPADLREAILETLPDYLASNRPTKYFAKLLESDRIVINPMPEGLSYDVDMTLADEDESDGPEMQGLVVDDEVVGTGPEVVEGDLVRVTYVGRLEDGTIFDASEYHEGYFEFVVGQSNVIEGWHQGLIGMQVGGRRILTIPPDLAYGSGGSGMIPPDATLTFEIELLLINGEGAADDDGDSSEDGHLIDRLPVAMVRRVYQP
jgi:hypothetical protein